MSDEPRADLHIEIVVNCPNCDYYIDLMRTEDTDGYDHNEDGLLVSQACTPGCWSVAHENFECEEVTCKKCKHQFNVKGLDW